MSKNDAGLTLIELLVSIAILGIVITLFLTVFNSTRSATTTSDSYYSALSTAEQTINEIRNQAIQNKTQMPTIQTTNPNINIYPSTPQQLQPLSKGVVLNQPTLTGSRHVSLQTVVYLSIAGTGTAPYLYTVTVSW